jgi:outer membrane protein assembly factor BamA
MMHLNLAEQRGNWRRLFLVVFYVVVMAAIGPVAARAQSAPSGSGRLAAITVTGSLKFHSDQIAPATGLHVGDQITRDDIQKGANELANLGLFEKVQYRFATVAAGVDLQYEVADAPSIPVFFDSFPWFSDADLIAGIESSVHLFDGTAPDHGAILDEISSALTRVLQSHGITVDVTHEVVTLPWNDRKVVRLRADGAVPTIQSIDFGDALANTNRAIADRLPDLIGKPFSRTAIQNFEYEQIRPVYISHACLHVKFGEPMPHVEANHVVVRAPINSGPQFLWSGVTWNGNQSVSSAELTKLVDVNLGGPADGMKIESTWENVRNAYAHLGYLDLKLDPVPNFDDATKRVAYVVKITEGPQYHMGKLVLTGLSMEGERRIRGAWRIPSGAVFDDSFYREFVENGIKEALAGLPVHYEKIGRYLDKDQPNGKIDVMLDFQ